MADPNRDAEPHGPDTPAASATEVLMRLSRLMTAVVARTLADVAETVTVPQLRILVMLYYDSPVNLTTIAQGLGVDRSNASRPADKLVNAGLVLRDENAEDRRNTSLSLTAEGRALVDSVLDRRRQILGEIVGHLSPADQEQLTSSVAALLDVVEQRDLTGMPPGSILPWIR